MPLGPLSFVNLAGRIARPFIQLGVRLGRTVAQIGTVLQRTGARVEAESIRRIVRAEEQLRRETRTVLGQRTDVKLPPSAIPEAVTRQRRQFAWRIRFGVVNRISGEVVDRYLTLSTDDLLSADDALAQGEDMLRAEYPEEFELMTESEIVQVTRAAPGRRL